MPAHNEIHTIREVVEGAMPHVDRVWVVDDGSTDGTSAALDGLDIELIRHDQNLGKGERLAEGLARAFDAGASVVVTLDADGQHDPAAIPAFLARAAEQPGAIILGTRFGDTREIPKGRARAIRFGNFFIGWACGWRISDAQCGMRLYPVAFHHHVDVPPGRRRGFVFETAALMHAAEAGLPFAEVPIAARYKGFQHRPSHFRPIADFMAIFGAVTAFLLSRRLRVRGLSRMLGVGE
ncbi:MAG: glycosyltransferase family 2 protein [Pseudomonadota bacterium]